MIYDKKSKSILNATKGFMSQALAVTSSMVCEAPIMSPSLRSECSTVYSATLKPTVR